MAASDEARRLLAKAGEDEYVLDRLLTDLSAPDAVLGFHAQQAAEKLSGGGGSWRKDASRT